MSQLDVYLNQLEQRSGGRIELELTKVTQVARELDLLQPACPVVTVAGTNGKGSCVAILQTILQAAGFKTGVYTSPHIWRFNERIAIDAKPLSDVELISLWPQIDTAPGAQDLTYFEFTTLLALAAFKAARVDVMILEVGLGGRLDAVNIIDPTVAVITSIGLDHQQYLGVDREAIASEKAGIFRQNGLAVCGDDHCPEAIKRIAMQKNVQLSLLGEAFDFECFTDNWSFHSQQARFEQLPIPKLALCNTASAIMALQHLPLKVTATHIRQALAQVTLPGRFQVVHQATLTWVYDVAHNPPAAILLRDNLNQLRESQAFDAVYAIFSALADKDIPGIIQPLASSVDRWYIAPLSTPRAASLEQLQAAFTALQINDIHSFSSVAAAKARAQLHAQAQQRILLMVFGSFYLIKDSL